MNKNTTAYKIKQEMKLRLEEKKKENVYCPEEIAF